MSDPDRRRMPALVACRTPRGGPAGSRRGAAMSVQVKLLGGFGVARDDVPVAADVWGRRQAAQLVQLLALTRDRRMHREQVIDALWPGLSWDTAAPRLHKAAHYARRALDDPDAVVLRQELVGLFPGRDDVEVDVHEFTPSRPAGPADRRRDARRRGAGVVRRPAAARGPLRAVERRAPHGCPPAAPGPPPAAGPMGRRAGRGARRRGGTPGPGPGARRRRRRPRRTGPARTARAGVARRARRRSGTGGRAAALGARAERRRGQGTGHRPGPPRRGAAAARLFGRRGVGDQIRSHPRRGGHGAGRHRAGRGSGRGGEVGGPRPGRRAGSPKGMEGGARSRLVGGGPVALLAGARSAQRTVSSPPRAAGRPGRQLSRRDRACPDRTGARVDG